MLMIQFKNNLFEINMYYILHGDVSWEHIAF